MGVTPRRSSPLQKKWVRKQLFSDPMGNREYVNVNRTSGYAVASILLTRLVSREILRELVLL